VRGVGGGALSGVIAIAAGRSHTCAVRTGGSTVCWGSGVNGQLGDGTTTYARTTPVTVKAVGGGGVLTEVISIASGEAHTCVVRTGGTAACWGSAYSGQLGDGASTQDQTVPVLVSGGGGFVPVAEEAAATGLARLSVYPNPARDATSASLTLPAAGHADVALYDALGRKVAVVFGGHTQSALTLSLDVSGLAPGVYVVRAVTGHASLTRTLVVAR